MKQIKQLSGLLFVLLCMVQLGVIGSSIWRYERIVKEGEVYFFNVLPLDPYDAFRGRYVTLRFENANKAPATDTTTVEGLSKAYAMLEHAKEGDRINEVRFHKPASGDFLEVNAYPPLLTQKTNATNLVHFSLPFDRFYLREDKAPQAEKLLRQQSGVKVRAKLRVLEGKGVIEDLMVGETSLSHYLEAK